MRCCALSARADDWLSAHEEEVMARLEEQFVGDDLDGFARKRQKPGPSTKQDASV